MNTNSFTFINTCPKSLHAFASFPLPYCFPCSSRNSNVSCSSLAVGAKAMEIMDVDDDAVREALRRHGVTRLIHGHTHRPGRHEIEVDGRRCERWVLPDWYGAGGYLEISGPKPRLVRFAA